MKYITCFFALICFGRDVIKSNRCPHNCECSKDGENIRSIVCEDELRIESDYLFTKKWTTIALKDGIQVRPFIHINQESVLLTDSLIVNNMIQRRFSAFFHNEVFKLKVKPTFLTVSNSRLFGHSDTVTILKQNLKRVHISNYDFRDSLFQPILALRSGKLRKFTYRTIQSLYIIESNIDFIDRKTFKNLPNLNILSLRRNRIKSDFDGKWFDHQSMVKLWFLDISHNSIRTINSNVLRLFPSLKQLKLNNNQIKTIDWSSVKFIWPKLTEFWAFNNELECKSLCWMNDLNTTIPDIFQATECSEEKNIYYVYEFNMRMFGC